MFSVIIPTYNRPRKTLCAVNSVLEQSFRNFELLVVDDGSERKNTDIANLLDNTQHKYIYLDQNHGVSHARNVGVKNSKNPFLAFLDSDDIWQASKLEKQAAFLIENPQCKIMQSDETWIRNGVRVNPRKIHKKPEGDVFKQSLKLCCISPSSVVLSRELLNQVGGFDEHMSVCEDYDLWLRISVKEKVGLLKEELVLKHGGHVDQLSHSVEAIDRFRVYSMIKLLLKSELSALQVDLVQEELLEKLRVLLTGAKKRENEKLSTLYGALLDLFKDDTLNKCELHAYWNDIVISLKPVVLH